MKSVSKLAGIALALIAVVGSASAQAKKSAEEMLKDIKAVQAPVFDQAKYKDKATSKAYVEQYMKDMSASAAKRGELILAFFKEYPENAETPKLMDERWMNLSQTLGPAEHAKDVDAILDTNPPKPIVISGKYWKVVDFTRTGKTFDEQRAAIDGFVKEYPEDARGARLLGNLARSSPNPKQSLEIYKLIVSKYPEKISARFKGKVKQFEAIGKPFELSFTEASSGKKVDIKDYKGKLVLIDFWATWCGPCVAELPRIKDLYKKYHDKGFEILGVSLDQPVEKGGLKLLQEFVKKNDVAWPQYYQGNFWQSEFSTSWGIDSIPQMFVISPQGKLIDLEGRRTIEEHLAKAFGK